MTDQTSAWDDDSVEQTRLAAEQVAEERRRQAEDLENLPKQGE